MRDVGVVIGRFQVPRLTSGHHAILAAASKHATLLVLIGSANEINSRNPLDYSTRVRMIQEAYPHAIVACLRDVDGDDDAWSMVVDNIIFSLVTADVAVTFYGGRDSFWPSYKGTHRNYQTVHQVAQEAWSGSTDRAHIVAGFNTNNEDFRRGVIYGVAIAGK